MKKDKHFSPKSWFSRLHQGLSKSRDNLVGKLSVAFSRYPHLDENFWGRLEEILIQADAGVETTAQIIEIMRGEAKKRKVHESSALKELLQEELIRIIDLPCPPILPSQGELTVLIIAGVNGTGKTTTVAKIAHWAKGEDRKVLLAAADTYRAAAIEQLEEWGRRLGVDVVKHQRGSDAAAVVYDGIQASKARGIDVLLIDTAGRLHTRVDLMEELRKVKKVAVREVGEDNVQTLLVVDATTGQNGLSQAKLFNEGVGIDGIILAKLDGTAKGGIVVAVQKETGVPVRLVGVGEKLDDLTQFSPQDFAKALLT